MSHSHQFTLRLIGGAGGDGAPPRHRRRRRGLDRCESPIERQLAQAFAQLQGFSGRTLIDQPWVLGRWEQPSLILLSQALLGPYRADFAIVSPDWRCPAPLPVVIECDGAEYHEQSADQIAKDRARDRFMVSRGAAVLRFSGREIWRDTRGCAEEALAVAARCITR